MNYWKQAHKETNDITHALQHGISTAYFTHVQPAPGTILRLPKVAKDMCIEQPKRVGLGVRLVVSLGVFNKLQNKRLLNPEKILEDVKKAKREKAKTVEAFTTTTMDDETKWMKH